MGTYQLQQVPTDPGPGELPNPPQTNPGLPPPMQDPLEDEPPPRRDPDVESPVPSPETPPMIASWHAGRHPGTSARTVAL